MSMSTAKRLYIEKRLIDQADFCLPALPCCASSARAALVLLGNDSPHRSWKRGAGRDPPHLPTALSHLPNGEERLVPSGEDRDEACRMRRVSLVHDRSCHPPALATYACVNMVGRLRRKPEKRQGCRLHPTSSIPRSMSPRSPSQYSAISVYHKRNQWLMLSAAVHENDLSQGRSSAERRRWHKDCS
jgi:hypothetical protein